MQKGTIRMDQNVVNVSHILTFLRIHFSRIRPLQKADFSHNFGAWRAEHVASNFRINDALLLESMRANHSQFTLLAVYDFGFTGCW